jgi:hypothetical protein
MRHWMLSLVAAFALTLAACEQRAEEAAPEPPVSEAPATDAPSTAPAPEPAPKEAEAPVAPTEPGAPSEEDRGSVSTRDEAATRSIARSAPVATPVIVEIDRAQERRPANGGSAVLLFSDASSASYRNTVTCVNVWNLMDTATTQEVRVGLRKAENGTIEALRPLYWMNRTGAPAAEQSCSQRLARYDFARAKTLRDKYGISTAGPHFIVARTDEQAAAFIDLTGKSDREIADLVRYFRDGFAFQSDIWDPARNAPEQKRALLTSFFGSRFRDSLLSALGFISSPAARAGCRLGDLKDAPCT